MTLSMTLPQEQLPWRSHLSRLVGPPSLKEFPKQRSQRSEESRLFKRSRARQWAANW